MKTLKLQTDIEVRVVMAALEQTRQDMGAILLNPGLNCLQAASYGMTQDVAHQLIERLSEQPVMIDVEALKKVIVEMGSKAYEFQLMPDQYRAYIPPVGHELLLGHIDQLDRSGLEEFLGHQSYFTNYATARLDQMKIEAEHEQTRAIWGGVGPLRPVNSIVAEENAALARRGVSDSGRAD
ncbi:hypothetical protein ACAW74_25835 [Fibrella sp. WM1]|uniref:hypothetical protein n=1 Tax=Fibrella musci TaxID=3242485 RepID=UPI00351FCB17